jgi:Spy/CpxP family protein refolding chaperone
MKKIIVVVLLSVVVAAPSFADDTSAKASVKKSPVATAVPPVNDRRMMRQKCDVEHVAGAHRGYGMMGPQGAGMMMEPGMHMFKALSLSEEQRSKISKLSDELKHDNWAKQGLINDETAKLRDLYEADKRDRTRISEDI